MPSKVGYIASMCFPGGFFFYFPSTTLYMGPRSLPSLFIFVYLVAHEKCHGLISPYHGAAYTPPQWSCPYAETKAVFKDATIKVQRIVTGA